MESRCWRVWTWKEICASSGFGMLGWVAGAKPRYSLQVGKKKTPQIRSFVFLWDAIQRKKKWLLPVPFCRKSSGRSQLAGKAARPVVNEMLIVPTTLPF